MSRTNSTPRAQSLVMPEDQPRAQSNSDGTAATLRLLLTAQQETNALLRAQRRKFISLSGIIWALVAVIVIAGFALNILSVPVHAVR